MLDEQDPGQTGTETTEAAPASDVVAPEATAAGDVVPPRKRAPRKRTAKAPATEAAPVTDGATDGTEAAAEAAADLSAEPAKQPAAKKAAAKRAPAKKAAAAPRTAAKTTAKKTTAKRTAAKKTAAAEPLEPTAVAEDAVVEEAPAATAVLFQAPPPVTRTSTRTRTRAAAPAPVVAEEPVAEDLEEEEAAAAAVEGFEAGSDPGSGADSGAAEAAEDAEDADGEDGDTPEAAARRRRRRGGRRRRKPAGEDASGSGADAEGDSDGVSAGDGDAAEGEESEGENGAAEEAGNGSASSRRRRRRRRAGEGGEEVTDDPQNTVTRVRTARSAEDEITSFTGSTRLEAKKQRRREGREAGRRRAPIISEAEFLARREAVDRKMVIRQREGLTQIAVLEDKVLVEHYVARESQSSMIGNVYLGKVQNVLPSMEAAFIDIGKGRNAVLYAGEVNWGALGAKDGNQRKIEAVLKPGQAVLVQVTKDPIGHKGARLTSQVSLPGRFLVYVPDGTTSGISRKLPENERNRLKTLLKEIVPESAGVIVRTAAEGASEEELTRDVERLMARWVEIEAKVAKGEAPSLLYGEPDLTVKVVRDLFTEDISKLVVSGEEAWTEVQDYVEHVAPDLAERLERHPEGDGDAFAAYRIDEQIAKGLDRKVWLPSGGSLIIDRTEAMTVIDVNTGKFTGSGGNLEETVTKNNLEAAEEVVRQLRLRDIGGIIVVDFIDMVLESNRDLVLRRLIECLGRDRTRHQVAEVTSLGLVQMTRKRIGTGLLEAFSENCEHCQGRGLIVHHEPVEAKRRAPEEEPRRGRRTRGPRVASEEGAARPAAVEQSPGRRPTPAVFAAMAHHVPASVDEGAEGGFVDEADALAGDAEDLTGPEVHELSPEVIAEITSEDSVDSLPMPEDEPEPQPQAEAEPDPQAEVEVEVQPEPEAEVEVQPEPVAPRVVTTVRRGARRAAGPPVAVESTPGALPEEPSEGHLEEQLEEEPGATSDLDGDLVPAHVPVKKRGARKR